MKSTNYPSNGITTMFVPEPIAEQYMQMFKCALRRGDPSHAHWVVNEAFRVAKQEKGNQIGPNSHLDSFLPLKLANHFNDLGATFVRDLEFIEHRDLRSLENVADQTVDEVIDVLRRHGVDW